MALTLSNWMTHKCCLYHINKVNVCGGLLWTIKSTSRLHSKLTLSWMLRYVKHWPGGVGLTCTLCGALKVMLSCVRCVLPGHARVYIDIAAVNVLMLLPRWCLDTGLCNLLSSQAIRLTLGNWRGWFMITVIRSVTVVFRGVTLVRRGFVLVKWCFKVLCYFMEVVSRCATLVNVCVTLVSIKCFIGQ